MLQGWKGSYYRYKEFFLNVSALYKKRADLRSFLEIILSITTIILFLVFALKPTAITIIDLLGQIKEKGNTLTSLTKKVSDLQKAGSVLSQNERFIPDIDIAVPTLPNPDIFSGQIEGLAIKNSVDILGISIDQITLTGDVKEKSTTEFTALPTGTTSMPFSISVRGTFPNLISFVNEFENLRIVKKIDTLGISSATSEKGVIIVVVISGRVPFTK